ncbi:conserved hypothetical protein [Hyphomicrobiales bacterium]|nr:conserved hypothetical protein [Hyphomicrobiales bacterium]CAH1699640.1 conserved hypothetical protein [Hyphomicrobiales bacterium]CAI0343374.1 conserved hypothetical protein [Hyphomicrobiales bacterium]
MKAKTDHQQDGRPSEPAPRFELETQEDYALAVDRLNALEAGQQSEGEVAEADALRAAIKAWDGRHAEL